MKFNNTIKLTIIILMLFIGFKSNAQQVGNLAISSFSLEKADGKLWINWTTGSADLYNYFEIEKSKNGQDFKTFAYVLGADPQKEDNEFGYYDNIADQKGKVYYRIKHVTRDGGVEYSNVQKIKL